MTTVEKLFEADAYATCCEARVVSAAPDGIRLDRTVFYAMGGGQPGDQGVLRLADGSAVEIVDTRKGEGLGDIVHLPAEGAALPASGDAVTAEIDWGRRHRLMRIHTCLHLLCAVVDGPVTGGQISDAEAVEAIFDLAEHEGHVLGGSSGVNIAGAVRTARDMGPGHTIVTMLCDYGDRYQSKLYNPAFLREKGLPVPGWLV